MPPIRSWAGSRWWPRRVRSRSGCGIRGVGGGALSGLYLLGLCAAGWALVPLRLSGGMLLWLGTVVLAAYAVLTSYLWSRRASFRGLAERWGIAVRPEVDAEASPSLLIAANLRGGGGGRRPVVRVDPDRPRRDPPVERRGRGAGLGAGDRPAGLGPEAVAAPGRCTERGGAGRDRLGLGVARAELGHDRARSTGRRLRGTRRQHGPVRPGPGEASSPRHRVDPSRAAPRARPAGPQPAGAVRGPGRRAGRDVGEPARGDVRLGGDPGGGDLPDRGRCGTDRRGGAGPRPAGADASAAARPMSMEPRCCWRCCSCTFG